MFRTLIGGGTLLSAAVSNKLHDRTICSDVSFYKGLNRGEMDPAANTYDFSLKKDSKTNKVSNMLFRTTTKMRRKYFTAGFVPDT